MYLDDGKSRQTQDQAAAIIAALTAKLDANQRILALSRHGAIAWRVDAGGRVVVELRPRI